eukprot:4348894-Pleurochrysis_carterae.AAC.1
MACAFKHLVAACALATTYGYLDENDFSGTIAADLSELTAFERLYVWHAAPMELFVLIFAPWLLLHLECSTRPRWTLEQ